MRRWSVLCVSSAFAVLAAALPGQAQSMSPSDVTTMLAKSHTIDARCKILAEADGQELMDFLARAEILLAEKESVKVARAAITKGKTEGGAAACGPDQDKLVRGVLAAARASTMEQTQPQQEASTTPEPAVTAPHPEPAVAAAPPLKPTIVAEAPAKPQKPKPEAVKLATAKKKEPAKPAVKLATTKKKASSPASLNRYASLATRYYTELKCRNMSGSDVRRLYGNVLSSHRQAVAENGASAVRSVLRTAEARANASSCG